MLPLMSLPHPSSSPTTSAPHNTRSGKRVMAVLGSLALLAGLGYWSTSGTKPQPEHSENEAPVVHQAFKVSESEGSLGGASPLEISVTMPQVGGIPRKLVQTGSLMPAESAKIHSRVSGYVEHVHSDIGMLVEEGDVLVEIHVPELEQELLRAQATFTKVQAEAECAAAQLKVQEAEKATSSAELEQAQADIARYASQRKLREKEFARLKALADRGSIETKLLDEKLALLEQAQAAEAHAAQSIEVAKARLAAFDANIELARSEVRAAESSVLIAEVDVQQAQVMMDYGKISAPFTGVVTSRNCDLGDFVKAAAQGSSLPLFTIAQTGRMRVVISVPDRMVPFIRPGDSAEVRIDSLYGEVFTGQVARVSMRQDRQTRSMRAEIDLPNKDGRFIEGMYGSVTITSQPPQNTVTVPMKALVGDILNGIGHFRVVDEGRVKDVVARIGLLQEGRVELVNWNESKKPIILEGGLSLRDGGLVESVVYAEGSPEMADAKSANLPTP